MQSNTDTCSTPHLNNDNTKLAVKNSEPENIIQELGARVKPIDVDAYSPRKTICTGFVVNFEKGQNPHLTYPFGLHAKITLPWNYSVHNGTLILYSQSCNGSATRDTPTCQSCRDLPLHSALSGILSRAELGMHENSGYSYYGFGVMLEIVEKKNEQLEAMRLKGLNNMRQLMGQAESLSDYNRFLHAMANGFEFIQRVIRVNLNAHAGIKKMINQYIAAGLGLYKPKSYTEEDDMRGLLLWKLGGNRVAEIAHRSLGLPAITTLRNRSIMPPIVPSPAIPTTVEISKNLRACFDSIKEVLASRKVVHQVLMLDEIATEKRLRWDHKTNNFLGICREHADKTNLKFGSEADMEEIFDSLDRGEVHYAAEVSCLPCTEHSHADMSPMSSQATIAALGLLSKDTRVYAARPILVSGDCKRETGTQHAQVIGTILEAVNSEKSMTHLRVTCISSDGETRRGTSFVLLTCKHALAPSSNIFTQIYPLRFMNMLVGDDDLTGDKDWKHVFKRFRNLILRALGIVVQGVRITPAIIRSHFQATGLSTHHIHALFNPDDKQDVKLAFDLLKDIWSLPNAPESATPRFIQERKALQTLGKLFYHVVFPYLCVDLTLSEQLEHLSAAAHLALVLYREARKEFMPTLLYTDLMIMIKNAFFCVAKAKQDDPDGEFWLMLLGTDRLEELFGILRTMVGNDANLDILQLVGRLSGTTEVSNILAKYPHWDRSPRRLKVPAITRDSQELPDDADHIKPASWRGDVRLKQVTLLTCWKRGRRLVEEEILFAVEILSYLDALPGVDILSPFGTLLMNIPLEKDDHELNPDAEARAPVPASPSEPAALSREFEDAAAEEEGEEELITSQPFDQFLVISDIKVSKTRLLARRSKYVQAPSSTDRLRRVQDIERFPGGSRLAGLGDTTNSASIFGEPRLIVSEPIATLIRCDQDIFLGIGAVNNIMVDSKSVDQVQISILMEQTVSISYQLLGLVPATTIDDPELRNDWRTFKIKEATLSTPGRLILPINPTISTRSPTNPFYLLESRALLAFASDIFGRLTPKDLKAIPKLSPTKEFPYREVSGMFSH